MHPDMLSALVSDRMLQRREDAANARRARLARHAARAGRNHPPIGWRLRSELGFLLVEAGLRLALRSEAPSGRQPAVLAAARRD